MGDDEHWFLKPSPVESTEEKSQAHTLDSIRESRQTDEPIGVFYSLDNGDTTGDKLSGSVPPRFHFLFCKYFYCHCHSYGYPDQISDCNLWLHHRFWHLCLIISAISNCIYAFLFTSGGVLVPI